MTDTRNALFKELVEEERNYLKYQALKFTRNMEDAEDLLHDTIVLAHKGFHKFKNSRKFRSWCRKIMLNHHINKTRSKEAGNVLVDDFSTGLYDPMFYNSTDHNPDADNPEKIFLRKNIDGNIMEAFYMMNDEHKQVFKLYHFEGYQYDEIARTMDIPVGTVKSRIFRAREYLIDNLKSIKEEAGYEVAGGRL